MTIHFEVDQRPPLNSIITTSFPRPSTPELIHQGLKSSINPGVLPFRRGRREWKAFHRRHKKIFKDVAGDLLIRLGYEKDQNW
jgi:hypothetical protein